MPSAGALVRLVSFTRSWIFINVKEFIPTSSFVLSLLTSLALLKFAVNCWTRSRRNRKEVGGGKACQDLFELVTPASFCSLRVASHCLQDLLLGYVIQLVCTPNEEHRVTRAEGGTPKCPSVIPGPPTSQSKAHSTIPQSPGAGWQAGTQTRGS